MKYRQNLASKVARWSRKSVNSILRQAGVRLSRIDEIVDLCNVTNDPVEGAYRAGRNPFLLDLPLAHCRILPCTAFPCAPGSNNPFVETLLGYACGDVLTYEQSPLANLYRSWQPKSAAEALGVDGPASLTGISPLGFTMPWSGLDPAQSLGYWQSVIEIDNQEHGARAAAALGWKAWGPVDPLIGALEFRRLTEIYDSIRQNGYCRSNKPNGDIEAFVLSGDGEYRFIVTTGHHRSAALVALGKETATIRLQGSDIVRRIEVETWPNVRTGLYTAAQALAVFDRLFDGRQPSKFYQKEVGLGTYDSAATAARRLASSAG